MSKTIGSEFNMSNGYLKLKNYETEPGTASRKVRMDRIINFKLYKTRKTVGGKRFIKMQEDYSFKHKLLKLCSESLYTYRNFDTDDKEFEKHERAIHISKHMVRKENTRQKNVIELYNKKLERQYRRHKLKKHKDDFTRVKSSMKRQQYICDGYDSE